MDKGGETPGLVFALSEHREIARAISTKENFLKFADGVYVLRKTALKDTSADWETVKQAIPSLAGLENCGEGILRNTYLRHRDSLKAASYWEQSLAQGPQAIDAIKTKLGIPQDVAVVPGDISFANGGIVIQMDRDEFWTYYRKFLGNEAANLSPNFRSHGFISTKLFLRSPDGAKCPVAVFDKTFDANAREHELEHLLFFKYYWRLNFQEENESSLPRAEGFRAGKEWMDTAVTPEARKVAAQRFLSQRLRLLQTQFYSELVSDIAGGRTIDLSKYTDLNGTARTFSAAYLSYALTNARPGRNLRDFVEGVKDSMVKSGMTEEEYFDLVWQMEKDLALFDRQNRIIEIWVGETMMKEKDKEKLLSMLESVPMNHPECLAYFLDLPPADFASMLLPPSAEAKPISMKEVEETALQNIYQIEGDRRRGLEPYDGRETIISMVKRVIEPQRYDPHKAN